MPQQTVARYTTRGNILEPTLDNRMAVRTAVRAMPNLTNVLAGSLLGETNLSQNETHVLAANKASAGTFTLTFRGQTTAVLNYNDTRATIQAALIALVTIGTAGVALTGGTGASDTLDNCAGFTITWSGTNFAGQPIELPTLTIVSAFATTQPTLTRGQSGQGPGFFGPYDDDGANTGLQTAKCLNAATFSTDEAGNVIYGDAAVLDMFAVGKKQISVFVHGFFRTDDLPQSGQGAIDAAGIADLGRLISGTSASGVLSVG